MTALRRQRQGRRMVLPRAWPALSADILARLNLDDLLALEQGMRAISQELRDIRRSM